MSAFDLHEHPHRRLNPLTGLWTSVAPHRMQRPWHGHAEQPSGGGQPRHDPDCYLCPRNERAGGTRNPDYAHTFVFDNDFASLRPETRDGVVDEGGLLRAEPARGTCRVLCFSPRHDLSFPQIPEAGIRRVVDVWAAQTEELSAEPYGREVFVFENRGAMMGASSPHPHGQIWATGQGTNETLRERERQQAYAEAHGRPLLDAYLALELAREERIVCTNDHFVALVPFWATWPFETLVLPRRPVGSLPELTDAERDGAASLLRRLCVRYDHVFDAPFPYSMGWHQRPFDGAQHPGWVLHAHFYPPLLRSATVRKFMVGFEMLGEPLRDLTPEAAAARLRDCSEEASAP